jgi:zinc protease
MNLTTTRPKSMLQTTLFHATCAVALLCCSLTSLAGIPIQHWKHPSGSQVYLVESPAIPMLDVQIDFDAGSRRDPQSKAGLAQVTAQSTANGVRAHNQQPALNEEALGQAWADLGASFSGSASNDRMSYRLRTLSYPDILPKTTALAARQLAHPAFPENAWQRDRVKWIAAIKEAATRPATVASRAYQSAVYGKHPYGWEATERTVQRISVQDMRKLHQQIIRPCAAKISMVGAVQRAEADALVTQLLALLPADACPHLPQMAEVEPLSQPQEVRIAFPAAQAQVFVGQPGYKRSDPDFFALTVGNHILGGGGFTSRLTTEVREKRGLTYSVYSYFEPGLHAGAFTVGLQTRPDQAEQALQLVRQMLHEFVQQGPTEAELQAAKDNLIGGFALRIDNNRKLLDNIANIAWNQLPLDYLDTWTQQVQALSTSDIRAAFARKLQPATMATVVLGGAPAP